jgi:hypothetical protein
MIGRVSSNALNEILFHHAVPHPIEGLTPGHADIRVPTFRNGLWRLH